VRMLCAVNPPEAVRKILDCIGLPMPTAANSPCVHTVRRSRRLTDIASRRYNSDVSGKQAEPA
jgi:hypothetical protein